MPRAWSAKDERQYEHIKESELKEGRGTKRAKAIAAATVNKHRASEGRTTSAARKRTGSTSKRKTKTRKATMTAGRRTRTRTS